MANTMIDSVMRWFDTLQAGLRPGMHIRKLNGEVLSGANDYQMKLAYARGLHSELCMLAVVTLHPPDLFFCSKVDEPITLTCSYVPEGYTFAPVEIRHGSRQALTADLTAKIHRFYLKVGACPSLLVVANVSISSRAIV